MPKVDPCRIPRGKMPHSKKKKILFHSCHSRQFTGFGKNCKNVLRHLQSTGKYDIVEFANAQKWNEESLSTLPWKCIGSGPDDPNVIAENNQDPRTSRNMSYGHLLIDKVIAQEKPDIYIGSEDIWAFTSFTNKPWWNKINCMVWTTLDSLPLFPEAVECAPKIKHYYTWADFARKALHKEGFIQARCLRGSIETGNFYKIDNEKREDLRRNNNIKKGEFIIGFVFRNQLRKSVPNLLDGFQSFLKKNPKVKSKLLLHTGWHEGWDIPRLIKEKGINPELILTTYFCNECRNYKISPLRGRSMDCPFCETKSGLKTITVAAGINEGQLNEIYNFMDVYCHPFTSGGQEIPIQEAKLAELITLCTNYSCGEDMCVSEAFGLPLSWSEYRESGTQFIKASTSSSSICTQLTKVLKMKPARRKEWGGKAREFVIKNYSSNVIGEQLEKIIDEMPPVEYDFDFESKSFNVNYNPPNIEDDAEWVIDIYRNMFNLSLQPQDSSIMHWVSKIDKGEKRDSVMKSMKAIAEGEIEKEKKENISEVLDNEGKANRIAVVVPENEYNVLLGTSLLKGIKKRFSEKNIYFVTEPKYFSMLSGNPYVHKCIPYFKKCKDIGVLEGAGDHEGYFQIAYILPELSSNGNLHHNGKDITFKPND
mgnify:CR=1 FL=1